MKLLLCATVLILVSSRYQDQPPVVVETDEVKGIICADAKGWGFMFKGKKLWAPTKEQVLDAEAEIERFLEGRPPIQSPGLWRKLLLYKRQYVGFTVNGRRKIFCNFYCTEEPLACKPLWYEDGGDCFFQIEYDVEGRKVEKLSINGEA